MPEIDWEFELQKAQGLAESKSHTDVIDLKYRGGRLRRLRYETDAGKVIDYLVPKELYRDGFVRLVIDGVPIELTVLLDERVKIFFPVGMHPHARKGEIDDNSSK